jgi:hypothetical protein
LASALLMAEKPFQFVIAPGEICLSGKDTLNEFGLLPRMQILNQRLLDRWRLFLHAGSYLNKPQILRVNIYCYSHALSQDHHINHINASRFVLRFCGSNPWQLSGKRVRVAR